MDTDDEQEAEAEEIDEEEVCRIEIDGTDASTEKEICDLVMDTNHEQEAEAEEIDEEEVCSFEIDGTDVLTEKEIGDLETVNAQEHRLQTKLCKVISKALGDEPASDDLVHLDSICHQIKHQSTITVASAFRLKMQNTPPIYSPWKQNISIF